MLQTIRKCLLIVVIIAIPSSMALAGQQVSNNQAITKQEVKQAQKDWATGIIAIGKAYANKKDYKKVCRDMITKLYSYNYGKKIVMFKPTLASANPFRPTMKGAISYFVGHNPRFEEDSGFALNRWKNIIFNNDEMFIHNDIAIVMGEGTLYNYRNNKVSVEYTLGYIKTKSGSLKLFLQHFSLPFNGLS